MTTDPVEFEKGSRAAIEASRRALAQAMLRLDSLRKEPHGSEAVDEAIQGIREFAELIFGAIEIRGLAILALVQEVAADRRVTFLMVKALLQQCEVDREQLHSDFLDLAKRMFACGPESFPEQARDAAIMLSGKLPA